MITLLVKDASKDMDDMQNLRPVSLMCTMKKLATRIMTDRLQKAAETRGTYTDMQFGFRAEGMLSPPGPHLTSRWLI